MDFNEYQNFTDSTDITGTSLNCILGLTGEVGEIAEFLKKKTRKLGTETIDLGALSEEEKFHLTKELGDVLWYLARFARRMGVSLEMVAELNWQKLYERKQSGTLHERNPGQGQVDYSESRELDDLFLSEE
jgi:NTP pyrophosphatase (non-canonical NTP hydrolase)